jgi:hypothetical protein
LAGGKNTLPGSLARSQGERAKGDLWLLADELGDVATRRLEELLEITCLAK